MDFIPRPARGAGLPPLKLLCAHSKLSLILSKTIASGREAPSVWVIAPEK